MIQLPFLPKTYHRLGQYIQKAEGVIAPSITIKQPTIWDVSFYNGAINWSTVSPRPFGVIIKATEWTSTDPQFASNWQQLGALKIPRACYHFYHNGQIFYNSARQAAAFVAAIQKAGGFTPNDYFIIDDEELDSRGNSLLSAGELVDFLYNVQVGLGIKDTSHLLIYSTAALLNNLSFAKLQPGQPQWIKQIRIWTAGYPNSPDSFSVPPASYIPNQAEYGKVVLWQYSDSVPPFGDINWIDPAFENEWAGQAAPPQPPSTPPGTPTINEIDIKVQDNQLMSVEVDGVDYTDKSHLTIGTTPLPVPTPAPQPQPAPKFGDPGIYTIKVRGLEYTKIQQPPVGTFAQLGGRGQNNWIQFGKNEIKHIQSFVHNADLWNWAATADKGTVYIKRDDVNQTVLWPMLVMSSLSADVRQQVKITGFKTDSAGTWAHVEAIPYQANGDYSAFTPDKFPYYFFWCYTLYPDGHIGQDSHNGMTFLMPIYDPSSGFKTAAGNTDFWVDADILKDIVG